MLSVARLRHLDPQQLLNRLMRRQNIQLLIKGVQWLCAAIMTTCVGVLLYLGAQETIDRRNLQTELAMKISSVRAAGSGLAAAPKPPRPELSTLTDKNVFGTLGRPTPVGVQPTAPPQTPLSLTLVGTFMTKGQPPYAIIEDKKKQNQDVFEIDQSIFNQAVLKRIFQDYVEIEREGKREILKLDDLNPANPPTVDGVASLGSDEFIVEEAELDRGLENLPLLLTQARAVPYFKEGRSIGLRLFAIKTGSLYEKIGLRNGDILKNINGNSLGDISQALKLFEQLKQERTINLVLERDKQDREFKYTIR
jgi:general secretion pathway protein C